MIDCTYKWAECQRYLGTNIIRLWWLYYVRPFLMQSDLSVENGLFRLKPQSGFLTQSKKGFFNSTFFD